MLVWACSEQSNQFRVKTFLIKGSLSPWRTTMLAIWMTGSRSASGKIPFRPAHSMSKLSILRGAIFCHSPSAGWLTKSSKEISTSIWHFVCGRSLLPEAPPPPMTVTPVFGQTPLVPFCRLCDWFLSEYFPAGSSIQLHPTTPVSTMNLTSKSMLASNTWNMAERERERDLRDDSQQCTCTLTVI